MSRRRSTAIGAVALLVVVACAPSTIAPAASLGPSSAGSIAPSIVPSRGDSPGPTAASGTIDTPEAAAGLVLATDPRFAAIGPRDPDVIGACCSWLVAPASDGWTVTIEIGWGDCPAGCIDRHHWVFAVSRTGSLILTSEDGPPVPPGVPGPGGDQTGLVGIRGVAGAGPVCPVERPNDPNCAPRPVVGAVIHIVDATGTEVAQLETDATGTFQVTLAPGRYLVRPDPVEGFMAAPAPVEVEVTTGLAPVELAYDTGIR